MELVVDTRSAGLYPTGVGRPGNRVHRCRPSDEPCWIETRFGSEKSTRLRESAAAERVSVDVFFALNLEVLLAAENALDREMLCDRIEVILPKVAPDEAGRLWQRYLAGGAAYDHRVDELPEIVMPAKLADLYPEPDVDLIDRVLLTDFGLSRRLEIAGAGMSMGAGDLARLLL